MHSCNTFMSSNEKKTHIIKIKACLYKEIKWNEVATISGNVCHKNVFLVVGNGHKFYERQNYDECKKGNLRCLESIKKEKETTITKS